VNGSGQFRGEQRIYHAMTLDTALSFESPRHNMNPEMRLAAGPMAGVTLMKI
jgi:hypothetical protein